MKGLRLDNPNGMLPDPGEYGRDSRGDWIGMTPNGHLANLSAHAVMEEDDGTITVHPSILVKAPDGTELWHGFLRDGVWEPCGHYWENVKVHAPAPSPEIETQQASFCGSHATPCSESSIIGDSTLPTSEIPSLQNPNRKNPTNLKEKSAQLYPGYPWGTEKARLEEWYGIPLDLTGKSVLSRHEFAKVAALLHCIEVICPTMTIAELLHELLLYARDRSLPRCIVSHLVEHPLFSDQRIMKLDGPSAQSDLESLMLHTMCGSLQGLVSLCDMPSDCFSKVSSNIA